MPSNTSRKHVNEIGFTSVLFFAFVSIFFLCFFSFFFYEHNEKHLWIKHMSRFRSRISFCFLLRHVYCIINDAERSKKKLKIILFEGRVREVEALMAMKAVLESY